MSVRNFAEILRHLPPSGPHLHLLDFSEEDAFANYVRKLRPDVIVKHSTPSMSFTQHTAIQRVALLSNSMDAITFYGMVAQMMGEKRLFSEVMPLLRAGGRFLAFSSNQTKSSTTYAQYLIESGFVRVLAEPLEGGVFLRGEKPYAPSLSTLERIAATPDNLARSSIGLLHGAAIENTPGRYLHLLIKELPNIPVWRRSPRDQIEWYTPAFQFDEEGLVVLAFSSLPKAVGFMQNAVLKGVVQDVNKIAKFRKTIGALWTFPILLNPMLEKMTPSFFREKSVWLQLDPETAETPDE